MAPYSNEAMSIPIPPLLWTPLDLLGEIAHGDHERERLYILGFFNTHTKPGLHNKSLIKWLKSLTVGQQQFDQMVEVLNTGSSKFNGYI